MSQAGTFSSSGGGGSGTVEFLSGNTGGQVGPDGSSNINVIGSGNILVTGNPGTNTLTITNSASGVFWNVITDPSFTMSPNNGYIINYSGTCQLTIPATSAVGDEIIITGMNNNTGWQVLQATGQTIFISTASTTTGASGSLTSSAIRDSISMVCIVANTTWNVYSVVGNITFV